jgi:hypothetical protein
MYVYIYIYIYKCVSVGQSNINGIILGYDEKNDENGANGVSGNRPLNPLVGSSCSLPQMAVSGYTLFLDTRIYMFVQILYHMSIFRIYSQT